MKILVIGYGSPIRGDDALGPLVADRLESAGVPDGVEVMSRHVLTVELVAELAGRDRVIFLDAAADAAPGRVDCRRLEPARDAVSSMAHFLDPAELLAWCETLYGHLPECFLISAGGASFDYANYRLTPIAERAVEQMLDGVRRLMADEACIPAATHQGRAAAAPSPPEPDTCA